jgi:hypothetical protein
LEEFVVSEQAIESGKAYEVRAVDGELQARVLCLDFHQRNWSRVATGEYVAEDGSTQPCFIKQYLDKAGGMQRDHWAYEKEGALVAARILAESAHVPELLFQDEQRLLNVFEFTEVMSIDVLLRENRAAFDRHIEPVLRQMAKVLGDLQNYPAAIDLSSLPTKERSYGSLGDAVNFKGFEIRNAGIPVGHSGPVGARELVVFDFVRPYFAPVEEAAAKLFVSVGMLNWGSPLGRFIKGPDTSLLASASHILRPWLDAAAIKAELDLQERFRTDEFKGAGGAEVALKRIGVDLLGKKYLRQLRRWCAKNIS